jgi:hypothetical protein
LAPAITRDSSRGSLLDVEMTDLVVAAAGETSVEVVLPEGRSCLLLCCSGGSWVAGVDAVYGPPHRDFTDDREVRAAPRRRPHRPVTSTHTNRRAVLTATNRAETPPECSCRPSMAMASTWWTSQLIRVGGSEMRNWRPYELAKRRP